MPLSFTIDSLFEDLEGSESGTAPSSNFLDDSVLSDPSTDDLATSALSPLSPFTVYDDGLMVSGDSENSADLFTISPNIDDSSAALSLSSPKIFDDPDSSSELFVSSRAGDNVFDSSNVLQPSDVLNPTIASSDLNFIAQGLTDPGLAVEYDATQLVKPNAPLFPELEGTLEELRKINAQDAQDSSQLCPAAPPQRAQCPPGKFPFCCLEGPPPRIPRKQDRRGSCHQCEFAYFRLVKERAVSC